MEKLKKPFKPQIPELLPTNQQLTKEEKLFLLQQKDQNDITSSSSSIATPSSRSKSSNHGGDATGDKPREVSIRISADSINGATEETNEVPQQQRFSTVWNRSDYDFPKEASAKGVGDFGFISDLPPLSPARPSKLPESQNTHGMSTPKHVFGVPKMEGVHRRSNNHDDLPPLSPARPSKLPESQNTHGMSTPKHVFGVPKMEGVHRRSNTHDGGGGLGGGGGSSEVLHCSANASHRRKSFLMTRSKSRLRDLPEPEQRTPQRTFRKSDACGKPPCGSEMGDDDENELFWDEDLPMDFRRMKFDKRTIIELVSLILLIAALVCTLTIPRFRNKKMFELVYWKWEIMMLVLLCGRLVSGWGIRIAVFFIEKNFMLRKRVLYFVYGLKKSVQNCIWLSLVLVAWQNIFDKKIEKLTNGRVLPYVTKIWVCLLVGTFVWLLKTLVVKVLASSFHVSTFFERIQESLFNQYVIETLSGPPLIEIEEELEEEDRVIEEVEELKNAGVVIPPEFHANMLLPPKSGRIFSKSGQLIGNTRKIEVKGPRFSTAMSKGEDEGITIDQLHRLNQKNISAWNMTKLMNIVRKGVLSTLDEQMQGTTGEAESLVHITSEYQAKIAAKKIFNNVAKPGSKHIYRVDVMRFMREDEACKTLRLFEGEGATGAESKGISKRALKNWVVNAFRERRALALSISDTKTAVNKLHQMFNVVIGIIIIVIWLLILKVASTHFFIFISSQLLLVVFVFGNTCKTTFEAIIFLFVMHPFDVGDRCEVDGVQMVVEEMDILTTVFLRYDNQKIMYPNSVLATKPISNYYRSPDMGEAIDFCIHISTPSEKIAMMKERITNFIEKKSDHWYPAPMIVLRDVEDMNRLNISIWFSHRMNHQDMGERWLRRSLVVEEMIKVLRELDIEYRMLPLDINVRNMPGLSSTRVPSNWAVFAK